LAGFIGQSRAPRALGTPYQKKGREFEIESTLKNDGSVFQGQ